MTDNEKRAHDFALVLVSEIMKPEYLVNEPENNDGKSVTVDLYQKYKQAYDAILRRLDLDYPSA